MSKPCKRGHVSERYASGYCIQCAKDRYIFRFSEIAAQKKIYAQINAKKFRELNKEWAIKNPERHKAIRKGIDARRRDKRKKWESEKAAHLTLYRSKYYEENKSALSAQNAAWKRNNKDKVTAYSNARRARELGAEGRFTADDIARLFEAQTGLCVYCRVSLSKYTVDHIIPLARGGSNYPSNLQLLCRSCNSKKAAKLPAEFEARLAA